MEETLKPDSGTPVLINKQNQYPRSPRLKSSALGMLMASTALVAAAFFALPPPAARAHEAPYRHYHPPKPGSPGEYGPPEQGYFQYGAPGGGQWYGDQFQPYMYVNVGPEFSLIATGQDFPDVNRAGYGASLSGGFRISQVFSFEINMFSGFHQGKKSHKNPTNGTVGNLALATKLHSPTPGDFSPYLQLGLGAMRFYDRDRNYSLEGLAWQLGGGVQYSFNRHLGMGAQVLYRSAMVDNEFDLGADYIERAYLGVMSAGLHVNMAF